MSDLFAEIDDESGWKSAPLREPAPRVPKVIEAPKNKTWVDADCDERTHQVAAIVAALVECPVCAENYLMREFEEGRVLVRPGRGAHPDSFRFLHDVVSVKFECGALFAAVVNGGISCHRPCLTASSQAVHRLFAAAFPEVSTQ